MVSVQLTYGMYATMGLEGVVGSAANTGSDVPVVRETAQFLLLALLTSHPPTQAHANSLEHRFHTFYPRPVFEQDVNRGGWWAHARLLATVSTRRPGRAIDYMKAKFLRQGVTIAALVVPSSLSRHNIHAAGVAKPSYRVDGISFGCCTEHALHSLVGLETLRFSLPSRVRMEWTRTRFELMKYPGVGDAIGRFDIL